MYDYVKFQCKKLLHRKASISDIFVLIELKKISHVELDVFYMGVCIVHILNKYLF